VRGGVELERGVELRQREHGAAGEEGEERDGREQLDDGKATVLAGRSPVAAERSTVAGIAGRMPPFRSS